MLITSKSCALRFAERIWGCFSRNSQLSRTTAQRKVRHPIRKRLDRGTTSDQESVSRGGRSSAILACRGCRSTAGTPAKHSDRAHQARLYEHNTHSGLVQLVNCVAPRCMPIGDLSRGDCKSLTAAPVRLRLAIHRTPSGKVLYQNFGTPIASILLLVSR